MIKVKEYTSIVALKRVWLEIEKSGSVPVYQSYFVQKQIYKRLPIYSIPGKYKPKYYVVLDNDKPVLIAPLCRFKNSNTYGVIGRFNGIQSYDFIYERSIDKLLLQEYLNKLFEYLNADKIVVTNILANSLVYEVLEHSNHIVNKTNNSNVCILFAKTYEEYYQSLSKHARQNIRTSYNRMKTDEHDWKFCCYKNEMINREILSSTIDLYCQRHEERYGVSTSKLKKFYLKHLDFSTQIQKNSKINIYATLYIDNNLAAFLSGVIDENNNSAVIPRLSINNEYAKYSPGIILINEISKYMIEKKIYNLDLSKGDEKYKFQMGGQEYLSHNFDIIFD